MFWESYFDVSFFCNLLVQKKWMQRCQQNERSDASWEHVCFYREVVLGTDLLLAPKTHRQ